MSATFLCPHCGAALEAAQQHSKAVVCMGCQSIFPYRLGILDLRGGRLGIAGAEFDAERDLARATELHRRLQTLSYREWFFNAVDQDVTSIEDPRERRQMRMYYRRERSMFGVHGDAIMAKLDAYLEVKEPDRYRRWRATAATVLEAGCGTGQYPIGFAKRFASVLVTDISYVSLVQAQKVATDFGLSNVQLFASNIEHLPLPGGSVDFVHCNGVIEHVADPAQVFAECSRVLSADGVALVLSPNRYWIYTEPHFRVPAFGFWPMRLRRWLAYRASGARSFAGTEPRSLGELRRYARASFGHFRAYMLPPRLPATARGGGMRRVMQALLELPVVGPLVDRVINQILLPVMPYHVIVGFRK